MNENCIAAPSDFISASGTIAMETKQSDPSSNELVKIRRRVSISKKIPIALIPKTTSCTDPPPMDGFETFVSVKNFERSDTSLCY